MTFKGHSRSSEMSRFDRAHMTSYCNSIVTMALTCIVSDIYPDIDRKSRNIYPNRIHAHVWDDSYDKIAPQIFVLTYTVV